MISEKEKLRFNRAKLSPRTKKIVTTALITLAVCAFFIWLGVGMYLSVPEEEREALLPMYFMYSVFPLLIIFFGAKRIYAVVNGKEDPDMSDCEVKEEIMIRPYEEKDWGSVEKIHDSARKVELSLAGLDAAFVPLKEAAVNEGLFDYKVDVALIRGRVAGFCAYDEGELAWLYVDQKLARRGVGRKLVENALEKEPGIDSVEVLSGNLPAKRLYEKMGFKLDSTETGKMPGNESFKVTVWCLKRDI